MSSNLQTHAHLYTHWCVPPPVHKIRPVIVNAEPTEVKDMAPIPLFPAGELGNTSLLKENDLVPCISKVWVWFLCLLTTVYLWHVSFISSEKKKTEKTAKRKDKCECLLSSPTLAASEFKVVFPAFLIMVTSILHGGSSDWKKERKVANTGAIFLKASHECIRH